jgi:phosphatidate cytidylyltransferase
MLLINELANLKQVESKFPLLLFAGGLLTTGVFIGWGEAKELIIAVLLYLLLCAFTLLRAVQPAREITKSFFIIAYVFLPILYCIQIATVFPRLILFIFILIWSSDSFAFVVGRFFGKRPLAPILSHKKTIEGFIGGIIGTISVAIIANYYWNLLPLHIGVSLALGVSIAAPLGDLLASAIKREADVKDSGVFLPGHGGALDRLDSFITAAPLAIIIYQYLS